MIIDNMIEFWLCEIMMNYEIMRDHDCVFYIVNVIDIWY